MAKLEIGVRGLRQATVELVKTARALDKGAAVRLREQLYFADMPTLLKTLTAERWRPMGHVWADGPMSINATARGMQRNYKNVHGDIGKLIELSLFERLDDRDPAEGSGIHAMASGGCGARHSSASASRTSRSLGGLASTRSACGGIPSSATMRWPRSENRVTGRGRQAGAGADYTCRAA